MVYELITWLLIKKKLRKMVLRLFTTFMVFERQFTPSWLRPNMVLLPGVIVPVFTEFTDII